MTAGPSAARPVEKLLVAGRLIHNRWSRVCETSAPLPARARAGGCRRRRVRVTRSRGPLVRRAAGRR
ncbi:hypothetical protein FSC37_21825 [Piscinibacter aquaticus]|uniref:Uncharacterized protein n=1 Tax=Piscinibacter aquaticus TaxID=392597 RepID=A0A5C6U660_9BURK|nr:hypothetical protein FSC37_21825 [Piscinibacter aquaticus]